jgi:hypothetical protein
MKQVFGAGQQGSLAVPITAGIAALGAGVFYMGRSKPDTTPEQDRKSRAEAKKAEGLSGAGIGGNAVTGGHELSHAKNSRSKEKTTAPLEKLPSGGVGGGVGGGGSNVRTSVEMTAKENSPSKSGTGFPNGLFVLAYPILIMVEIYRSLKIPSSPATSTAHLPTRTQHTTTNINEQGGANVAENGDQSQGFRDPSVASNHTETTTKKGPN